MAKPKVIRTSASNIPSAWPSEEDKARERAEVLELERRHQMLTEKVATAKEQHQPTQELEQLLAEVGRELQARTNLKHWAES